MTDKPPPSDLRSRLTARAPSVGMDTEPASPQSEPSTPSPTRSNSLPPDASLSHSRPPSSVPEASIAPTFASDASIPPLPSSSTPGRVLPSLPSSASDRLTPHRTSTHLGHGYTHQAPEADIPSEDYHLSEQEVGSEAPFVPQDDEVDDMKRLIDIVLPGEQESTHCAKMLIDSGAEENCISRKVVDRLGLTPSGRKLSFLGLVLNMLTPWTKRAKAAKKRSKERIRSVDGSHISGQGHIVNIAWYGKNESRRSIPDPLVWFRPIRYETTHVVVDGDCAAEVILGWKEVSRLGLRDKFVSPIRRPPTPEPDPGGKKYEDYEQRRANKKMIRDERRGNDQGQSSTTMGASQTGK